MQTIGMNVIEIFLRKSCWKYASKISLDIPLVVE
jgi:hypothetical protein